MDHALTGLIVLTASVLIALGVIIRFLNRVGRMSETLYVIAKEFEPNAGTSLKDALNRIEARLTSIEEHERES